MARTITIALIIALILALSLFSILYAKNTKDEIKKLTSEALSACESRDLLLLEEKIKSLSDLFEERQGFLSFYVRHDEIEKMESSLVSLRSYAKTGSFEAVNALLYQIEYLAFHIYQRELLNVDQLL